jgi:hypothetical protein
LSFMRITTSTNGLTQVVNDNLFYSVQQASAQEENTPASPFLPFSQQQEQEAVPEEEQRQQLTPTNQTTATIPTNQTTLTNETTAAAPDECMTSPAGEIYCRYVPQTNETITAPDECLITDAGIFCAYEELQNGEPVQQATPTNQTTGTTNQTTMGPTFPSVPLSQEQEAVPEEDVTTEGNVRAEGNITVGPLCPPGTVLTEGNVRAEGNITVGPLCEPITEEAFAQGLETGGETEDGGLGEAGEGGGTGQSTDCYHGGVRYSEGSIVKMEGILKECQNGKWVRSS